MSAHHPKYKTFLSCIVFICALPGCAHQENDLEENYGHSNIIQEYTIQIPDSWHEVVKKNDVLKQVYWGFSNNNYSKHTEEPLFRAWNAPEKENAFLTIMEVKRNRNLGLGLFYNQLLFILQQDGWTLQESGTTTLDGKRCKWWIQTHLGGALHQLCYLVTSGPYVYGLAFNTTYLSEEKQKEFQKIAESIKFKSGL